jgi:peptidoglycan hydrolase CwlO-like protein
MESMKKIFILVSLSGLIFSCSGERKHTESTSVESQEQVELIERSTQKLDETINSSYYEMEKNQNEIDSLLQNI